MNAFGLFDIVTGLIRQIAARRIRYFLRDATLKFFGLASLFAAFLMAMSAVWFILLARLGPVWASFLVAVGFLVLALLLFILAQILAKPVRPRRAAVPAVEVAESPTKSPDISILIGAVLLGIIAGTWGK